MKVKKAHSKKLKVIESRINNKKTISVYKYSFLSNEMKLKYLVMEMLSVSNLLNSEYIKHTPRSVLLSYCKIRKNNRRWGDDDESILTKPLKILLTNTRIMDGSALTNDEYIMLSDKIKREYIKRRLLTGRHISYEQFKSSSPEIQEYYNKIAHQENVR